MTTTTRASMLMLLLLTAGCTVQQTEMPALTGPSELALRLALQALPDSILQDGASQAALHIEASGPDGAPVRGLGLRLEILHQGVVQDFGTLSAKTVVTGEDGRARTIYTAPPRPTEPVETGHVVTIRVVPIGNDYRSEVGRTVDLRLVTPGVIQPPNSAPVAAFNFTPNPPLPFQRIVFDASATTDEGIACGANCTYRWDFGDGTSASGVFATHEFKETGTFQVRLTVTDARGASTTLAESISVGDLEEPTAAFTFSPTDGIAIGQTIFFNAEASRPGSGRRIVAYDWDFGSGRTGTGITTTKSYNNPGTYVVTLTVTDDAGAKGTTSRQVTVGELSDLIARLTIQPTSSFGAPQPVGTMFTFDASGSVGPSPITEYRFNFGDGSAEAVTTTPVWSYAYTRAGIFVASVTVRDATGRTARAEVTVYVQ